MVYGKVYKQDGKNTCYECTKPWQDHAGNTVINLETSNL